MRGEVAIIGCGPAGLLSASAAERAGLLVDIYSDKPVASPMARGVYLHEPVGGLASTLPDALITFRKAGTAEDYAWKVYGDRSRPTSWARFDEGTHAAWALAPVYAALWVRYRPRVRLLRVTAREAARLARDYRLVINTAPLEHLCANKAHGFERRYIWIEDGAPPEVERNSMLYNGRPEDEWYRASDLFGYRATEYLEWRRHARLGYKVVGTDCDCHPEIVRNGRYGMWTPGVLLHQAYYRAVEAVEAAVG